MTRTPTPASDPRRIRCAKSRGYAMVLVLIAIVVATVVSMGVLSSLTPSATLAGNTTKSADAMTVALGGLDAVEAYVLDDSRDWATDPTQRYEGTWFSDVAFGTGTYTVAAERTEGDPGVSNEAFTATDTVTFTSTATVGGVTAIATRTVVPEDDGSIRLLFVLDDQTSPTPGSDEAIKRDLMEGWGFRVSYISSTESQAVFDAAALVNDVAYITEDVLGSHVNTKLKAFTIGVVSEEAVLNDDFGFSSSAYAYNTTTIDITDNTHYITEHLPLGNHTIADSSQQMVYAYGTYAAGMQVLAERPSTAYPQLFVLDTGDALYGGGNAAGRRVMLPWGNSSSSFTFQEINADGHEIMKKAIEWAAYRDPASLVFQEVSGEVVMEAENHQTSEPGTGSGAGTTWTEVADAGAANGIYLDAQPNSGYNAALTTEGHRLDYAIKFQTTGTYRVWVRMIGPSTGDDSIQVGFNGTCLTNASGYGFGLNANTSWQWLDDVNSGISNVSFTVSSPGVHTFNLWVREDGTRVDKIVLNTSASQPSGTGPDESALVPATP